jgi:YHS domain-containing protein
MKAIISLSVIILLAIGGTAVALAAVDSGSTSEACDCGCDKAKAKKESKAKKSFATPPKVGTEAVCPVMGSKFKVTKDTLRSEYKGRHYVFCCPACKPKFDADPGKYTK